MDESRGRLKQQQQPYNNLDLHSYGQLFPCFYYTLMLKINFLFMHRSFFLRYNLIHKLYMND